LSDQSQALGASSQPARGYWSLWLFLVLFVLSLFPVQPARHYLSFEGKSYFPALVNYRKPHSAAT
jgi:ABC-type microcin C transport system permease subunit YejE